jgi:hypothetical protein
MEQNVNNELSVDASTGVIPKPPFHQLIKREDSEWMILGSVLYHLRVIAVNCMLLKAEYSE